MTNQVEIFDRSLGSLIGLAVGDALGAPGEFENHGTYPKITGYRDGGPFNLKAGQYTDDTSQALCLADAILNEDGFDRLKFLDNLLQWQTSGIYSSTGECFDIGVGTATALNDYRYRGTTTGPDDSAGNGALMRLAPAAIVSRNLETPHEIARESTLTTHGHQDAVDTSIVLNWLLINLIKRNLDKSIAFFEEEVTEELTYLCPGINNATRSSLTLTLSGKRKEDKWYTNERGWCVSSLNAAMHCLLTTNSFRECVIKAVNLGGDTDSVGAIAGQLAGAQYGLSNIPQEWVDGLQDHEMIIEIAAELYLKGLRQ